MYGKGVIDRIYESGDIEVEFDTCIKDYTYDGKTHHCNKRTLHQGHIDLPEPVLIPIVEYTKGEVIWYKDGTNWNIGFYESESWLQTQAGNLRVVTSIRKFDNPPTFKA